MFIVFGGVKGKHFYLLINILNTHAQLLKTGMYCNHVCFYSDSLLQETCPVSQI